MPFIFWSVQYVGKNEPPFNIRLNNHRKDVKDPKAILADKHFQKSGHRFNERARFTIIDRVANTNLDNKSFQNVLSWRYFHCLIQRGNFWIQKLETLYFKGLNLRFLRSKSTCLKQS